MKEKHHFHVTTGHEVDHVKTDDDGRNIIFLLNFTTLATQINFGRIFSISQNLFLQTALFRFRSFGQKSVSVVHYLLGRVGQQFVAAILVLLDAVSVALGVVRPAAVSEDCVIIRAVSIPIPKESQLRYTLTVIGLFSGIDSGIVGQKNCILNGKGIVF